MHVFSQPNPVMNKCVEGSLLGQKTGSDCKGVCKDKSISHENLCSTLNKLCLWEKKLYHEVKVQIFVKHNSSSCAGGRFARLKENYNYAV